MLNIAKKFFGKSDGDAVKEQERASNSDLRVAACALLLEMSLIDGKFSESEMERVLSILQQEYGLSDEEAVFLARRSKEELDESIDLWEFTNAINQNYSVDEKLRLTEKIWEIAYADGKLDQHEDYLVHKLANLLRLTHKQLIDAKLRAKGKAKSYQLNKKG